MRAKKAKTTKTIKTIMTTKTNNIINIIIILCYILATFTIGSAGAGTAGAGNAAHSAVIDASGGAGKYKAVRLTPPIYAAANSNLSDLLIKNSSGENIPYFINSSSFDTVSNSETFPMVLINAYLQDDNYYFDYKLAEEERGDTISTSILFETNSSNFAKEVDVYGSYDNKNWDFVQNDIIYTIDGKSKLIIDFNQPQKFTHIRLKLANNLEQISFNSVNLHYYVNYYDATYFIEEIQPEFNVKSENKSTEISIKDLKHLRLCDITINSGSMFQRIARAQNARSKEIYNLSLNGTSYADTTIPLDRHIPDDDDYIITIADADDKPIQIDGVIVRYYADELVFEASRGETYALEFSGNPAAAAPVYDITRYKDEILKGDIDKATIGAITFATIEEAPQERDYRLIFNIVIVAVALLLGAVTILKLRKKSLE